MRFALRAAAALFATVVAFATAGVSGAPVPEPGGARTALENPAAAATCTHGQQLAGYQPADTSPDSAARPAEPLPGAGLKNGTEPLAARERWSVARLSPPPPAHRARKPAFARQAAAARDGTLSARSTGLPPPA